MKTRLHLIYMVAAVLALTACSKADSSASGAAERYYKALIQEDYEQWVDGTLHSEAMTPEIRQERIDLAKQYLQSEREVRGGLTAAKALRDTVVEDNAFVFVELQFADSTSEEVLVPMTQQEGVWKMK